MSEAAPSRWLSDWKAGIVIIALETWLLLSLIIYYNVFIDRYFNLTATSPVIILSSIAILLGNYFAFVHTDEWKAYVKEFDALPKKKNQIGSLIVFAIVVLVIANLVFSFYLMSQIDWKQYK
jgi:hypothetical protein